MNTRKIDMLYRIVPGIMFLLLTAGYFINSAVNGLALSRFVFLGSFLVMAIASFIRSDSLPGLILLCLGLAVHTCRNAMRLLDLLSAHQPVLLAVNLLFALGFGLMLVLCLAYSSGTGGAALAGVWFLPAALMIFGFLLLQLTQGLRTDFWSFLYPIVSAAGFLLLGISASDPYFEEEDEEEDAPAPVAPRKPTAPSYTTVERPAVQQPAAPSRKPAAPAQKPAAPIPAPARRPATNPAQPAPLSPAAMEDLKLYKELLELGVITQAEFEDKKKSLAGQ